MKCEDLRNLIDGLTQDIDFEYRGEYGSICPFSRTDISLCFRGHAVSVTSVDAAMAEKFIDGKSLSEVISEIKY